MALIPPPPDPTKFADLQFTARDSSSANQQPPAIQIPQQFIPQKSAEIPVSNISNNKGLSEGSNKGFFWETPSSQISSQGPQPAPLHMQHAQGLPAQNPGSLPASNAPPLQLPPPASAVFPVPNIPAAPSPAQTATDPNFYSNPARKSSLFFVPGDENDLALKEQNRINELEWERRQREQIPEQVSSIPSDAEPHLNQCGQAPVEMPSIQLPSRLWQVPKILNAEEQKEGAKTFWPAQEHIDMLQYGHIAIIEERKKLSKKYNLLAGRVDVWNHELIVQWVNNGIPAEFNCIGRAEHIFDDVIENAVALCFAYWETDRRERQKERNRNYMRQYRGGGEKEEIKKKWREAIKARQKIWDEWTVRIAELKAQMEQVK